jgi:preprotein translocase subunit SecB
MATTNGEDEAQVPTLSVLAQYTKDLSFENPNAPQSLQQGRAAPAIEIQVNVNGRKLADLDYEVELVIEAKATDGESVLFNLELNYAGVFRIANVPEQNLHPLVLIECPRLLFPFARALVADAVRNGGFPPLMIDPVDFSALYRQRIMQAQQQGPMSA